MKYLTLKYYYLLKRELIRARDRKLKALQLIFGVSPNGESDGKYETKT